MADLHDLTALDQATAVRRREVSPVELAEHYLARIEERDAQVGAYITVPVGLVQAQAKAAEQAVLAGDPLATLHGIPVPVKDLVQVAGVRCTFGSTAYAEWVPDQDDGVVSRLRASGTVMLGKTHTCEFGLSCYTESDLAPPARTAWDLTRSAGGSSGGAGAAVSAGLAPVALGTDGGGSVRIPASACGLVGLKPSRGRVSAGPRLGDVTGLPTSGPLARTVRDAAAVLDILAGAWPGDPWPLPPLPAGQTFLAATERPPRRLRIGAWCGPVLADAPVHPQVIAAYEGARALLANLGHDVLDAPQPFEIDAVASFEVVWSVLSQLTPVDRADEPLLMPLTRWMRSRGDGVTGADYATAFGGLQAAGRAAAVAWEPFDVLLCPTLAQPAALVGDIRDDDDPAADFEAQKALSPYCAVYNVTGQPAVSLPLHWTPEGLPIGIQLAAGRGKEQLLLSLAAQLEEARPWHERRPPIW
jgi:amidase